MTNKLWKTVRSTTETIRIILDNLAKLRKAMTTTKTHENDWITITEHFGINYGSLRENI